MPATGGFSIDIYARDIPAANGGLNFFKLTLTYDLSWLSAAAPSSPLTASNGFSCDLPPPTGHLSEANVDADGNPATGDAFINCFNLTANGGPSGVVRIATIPFTITGAGRSPLTFFRARIEDAAGGELASCNPVDVQPGAGCLDGYVFNTAGLIAPTATGTPIPTPTATPTPTTTVAATPTAIAAALLGGADLDAFAAPD